MIQGIVEKYLGGHSHREQDEQYFYNCPKCGSSRFTVNYNRNMFRCWKCGYSSKSVISLLFELEASYSDISEAKKVLGIQDHYKNRDEDLQSKIDKILFNPKEEQKRIFEQKSWVPITSNELMVKRARIYMKKKRGISDYELNYYGVKYDRDEGMIVFPSYDINGDLNFYVKRTVGDYSFYKNCDGVKKTDIVFWESLIDFERPIILTEGIFDAMKLGENALPILGSLLPNRLFKLIVALETPEVTIFLDKDAEDSMIKMSEKFSNAGINVNNVFLDEDTDAGALTKTEIKLYLNKKREINKFSMIDQNLNSISL